MSGIGIEKVGDTHNSFKHIERYKSFGFVRNPYDWVESLYWFEQGRDPSSLSLLEWMDKISVLDTHSINQIDRLTDGDRRVHLIGRFEDKESYDRIFEILDLPFRFKERRQKIEWPKEARTTKSAHTDKTLRFTEQLYAKDFRELGYAKR